MNYKIIIAVAAAAFTTPAFAQGAYIQFQGGYDEVSAAGESDSGVAYGLALGYEFPLTETMFAGVEVSADDSSTKECADDVLAAGDELCIKTGRDLAAVVRLGANIGSSSQLYALGGYTNARLKVTYDDGVTSDSAAENGDGFRLGAGFKQTFSQNIYGKIEYRYSNYESDFSRHQVLAAIGFGF